MESSEGYRRGRLSLLRRGRGKFFYRELFRGIGFEVRWFEFVVMFSYFLVL